MKQLIRKKSMSTILLASTIAFLLVTSCLSFITANQPQLSKKVTDSTISSNTLTIEPIGMIVMWSGNIASIPDGWALCNGSQGTPDLEDKFILGISVGTDINRSGGAPSHNHTYTEIPNHTHEIIDPGHVHVYSVILAEGGGPTLPLSGDLMDDYNQTESKTTGISVNYTGEELCSTQNNSTLPPYYKLAFIMKVNISSTLPVGAIVMWPNSLASIPEGYALCNGTGGTPDLMDKFIMSVSTAEEPNATGGVLSHNHVYTMIPNHTHEINDPGHTHDLQMSPGMMPGVNAYPQLDIITPGPAFPFSTLLDYTGITINYTGVALTYTEPTTSLPPYYKLAYIMKMDSSSNLSVDAIVMWSNSLASIPGGYAVCNGEEGTPNLLNKFIMGVSESEDPGTTGGALSHKHIYTMVPNHTHEITDPGHFHDILLDLVFDHLFAPPLGPSSALSAAPLTAFTYWNTTGITLIEDGTPSPNTDPASSLPPYQQLAFIEKVSESYEDNGIIGFEFFFIFNGFALISVFYFIIRRRQHDFLRI